MNTFILFFRGGTGDEIWTPWIEELKRAGAFVDGAPLVKNGKIVSDDGVAISDFRFDLSENARGYVVMRADDIEHAIELARDCPVFANGGNITIRPIEETF